jgi:F-type H+-transporting ATPase subunit gamma
MTAERGLAGAFNGNIVRMARDHIRTLQVQGKQVKLICVGRKGADVLRREFDKLIIDKIDLRSVRQLTFEHAQSIANNVLRRYENGEFDVMTLYFSEFKNILTQKPKPLQLIPVHLPEAPHEEANSEPRADYTYEPEEEYVLNDLLPRNVATQIFRALLENLAGFYASQMSAMDSATRNAGEMIDKLTLTYNRSRQAQITKELIEIISGAEAL